MVPKPSVHLFPALQNTFACALAFLFLLFPAMAEAGNDSTTTGATSVLRTLRKGHPRLLALDENVSRTRELIRTDPLAAQWHRALRVQAQKVLEEAPVKHELVGPRLLFQSRKALDRISLLGLLYRLDGDEAFAERAKMEMHAVCAFPDWNPSHFLDTAEMSNAVGLGYDWLYHRLSAAERDEITSALVRLGLEPGAELYAKQRGWVTKTNNWNQVCTGGMIIGALAIADERPELAEFIVASGVESLKAAMAHFAPDGGWVEALIYWGYTLKYCAYGFSALETALGTVFGLDEVPGFSQTGYFPLAMIGPTGRAFNWGDGSEQLGNSPSLFWLAQRFKQPLFAWAERNYAARQPDILDLLWLQPQAAGPRETNLARDWHFRGIHAASMREEWENPAASFVALKGGLNHASHSNLDLGSFVFDADGVRWASELGSDDYNMPGYWDKRKRFTYYRLGTIGQNTIMIDGSNQAIKAEAPITIFGSTPAEAAAIVDMTDGYRSQAAQAHRGFHLCGARKHLLIQDEIQSTGTITWNMHTRAQVEGGVSSATLTSGEKRLLLRVLEPRNTRVEIESAEQQPPQASNSGVSRITFHVKPAAPLTRIAVLLTPASAPPFTPHIEPLEKWRQRFPQGAAQVLETAAPRAPASLRPSD